MRFLLIGLLFFAASPAVSATINPWNPDLPLDHSIVEMSGYLDVLAAFLDSYRDVGGPAQPAYPVVLSQSLGLSVYALAIAALLPRRKRYPAWAAEAISRIRWTMARRPFDR